MTRAHIEEEVKMTGPTTRENLFAFTAPGSQYPGFVSINREPNGDITFHVRSAALISGKEGAQAVFTIKKDEWPGFPFIAPA